MIVGAWLVGAALCAVGTRASAAAFVAVAALSATEAGPIAAAGTWVAATAAGLAVLGTAPRRLAVPAVGATAVAVASQAPNAAAVLPAWTVAALAVVVIGSSSATGRRWALGVLAADTVLVGAVVATAVSSGFATWPAMEGTVAPALFLAAAAVRLPLLGGALDRDPAGGLLVVRFQVLALVAVAMADPDVARAGVVLGAAVFAGAPWGTRPVVRDAAQEAGLWSIALGAATLGWTSDAWAWAALAAGTLTHLARRSEGAAGMEGRAWELVRSGTIGAPLFAAAMALAAAAVERGEDVAAVVPIAVIAGLWGRLARRERPPRRTRPLNRARGVLLVCAVALGLWAPLGLDPGASGVVASWLPAWAVAVVLAAAAVGGLFPSRLAPARVRRRQPAVQPSVPVGWFSRPLDVARRRGALAAPVAVLAAAALSVWAVAWTRGFL